MRRICFYLLIFLSLLWGSEISAQLVVNEIMSSNRLTIADEDGEYSDWIEIVNGTNASISLEGYYLSDDASDPERWSFPNRTLAPGEYLVIFASGKNRKGQELHTNYKIKKSGEPILLSNPEGSLLDFFPATELEEDEAFGRYPDRIGGLRSLATPTPGQPNVAPVSAILSFSLPSGFYTEVQNLTMETSDEDAVLYYTLNGDLPDTSAHRYSGPIDLPESDDLSVNPIVYIPTSPDVTPDWYRWKLPGGNPFRARVVRAAAFVDGERVSPVETATYWVDPQVKERFELPVISIVTEESNLFGYEEGLLVPGKTFDDGPPFIGPWVNGNYTNRGRAWEREAEVLFFDSQQNLELEQTLGLRLHGGGTRSLPAKAFRLYAREAYGTPEMNISFFEHDTTDTYKRILLRPSGQDFVLSMLRDGLTHEIIRDLDVETQGYQPAVLFVNGAYYGLVNIRDRHDKYYFQYRFGTREEDLDLLEFGGHEIIEGQNDHYLEFLDQLRSMPRDDAEAMEKVADFIDVDNFIDYTIAKMFFGVFDWPGNNIKFWKDRGGENRWRWLYYDNDDAFDDPNFNAFDHLTDMSDNGWPNPLWSTEVFRLLMEVPEFREKFFQRVISQLNTIYHSDNTLPLATSAAEAIEKEMPDHIDRWKHPSSLEKWYENIDQIKNFLSDRPCTFFRHMMHFYEIPREEWPPHYCSEIPDDRLSVFPNPATDRLYFYTLANWEVKEILLFDISGKQVVQHKPETPGTVRLLELNIDHLIPGAYVYQLQLADGEMRSGKIIKVE